MALKEHDGDKISALSTKALLLQRLGQCDQPWTSYFESPAESDSEEEGEDQEGGEAGGGDDSGSESSSESGSECEEWTM